MVLLKSSIGGLRCADRGVTFLWSGCYLELDTVWVWFSVKIQNSLNISWKEQWYLRLCHLNQFSFAVTHQRGVGGVNCPFRSLLVDVLLNKWKLKYAVRGRCQIFTVMRLAANISLIVAFNNKKNVDVKLWGILLSSLSAIKKFYSLKKILEQFLKMYLLVK